MNVDGIEIVVRSGGIRINVSCPQGNHDTSGTGRNLDRRSQLVPSRLVPGLSDIVSADVLQDGIEENLVIVPDRANCLGLLAKGTQTNLKYG